MTLVSQLGEIQIHHVKSAEDAKKFREGAAQAYVEIFAGEPYNERFSLDEARKIWDELTSVAHHITLVATIGAEVVGFGVAVPLRSRPSVSAELVGLVPVAHTMYLAELGIHPKVRQKGLGRELIMMRLKMIDPSQFTHVVLRVSEVRNSVVRMYQSLGFSDMGVYMKVNSRRTDGSVRTDDRLFMSKVLSQVKL